MRLRVGQGLGQGLDLHALGALAVQAGGWLALSGQGEVHASLFPFQHEPRTGLCASHSSYRGDPYGPGQGGVGPADDRPSSRA